MTALEMKYKFDIKMRELLKALNHPFNTHEVNRLLNESQLKIVLEYAKFFDRNEDVKKILSILVTQYETTTIAPSTMHANAVLIDLPADLVNIAAEKINDSESIRILPMSHDGYIVNVTNPFRKPDSSNVWRIDRNDQQELITDGSITITSYKCDYIRVPTNIDIDNEVDCELSETIHEDIIDGAIRIALDIINRTLQTNKSK